MVRDRGTIQFQSLNIYNPYFIVSNYIGESICQERLDNVIAKQQQEISDFIENGRGNIMQIFCCKKHDLLAKCTHLQGCRANTSLYILVNIFFILLNVYL